MVEIRLKKIAIILLFILFLNSNILSEEGKQDREPKEEIKYSSLIIGIFWGGTAILSNESRHYELWDIKSNKNQINTTTNFIAYTSISTNNFNLGNMAIVDYFGRKADEHMRFRRRNVIYYDNFLIALNLYLMSMNFYDFIKSFNVNESSEIEDSANNNFFNIWVNSNKENNSYGFSYTIRF